MKWKNPLVRPAAFLYDRVLSKRISAGARQTNEEVKALEGGRRSAPREYQIKKLADVLAVAILAVMFGAGAVLYVSLQQRTVEGGRLKRADYGGLSKSRELAAQVEDMSEAGSYTVQIGARKYSHDQVNAFLEAARDELEENILGDNESHDRVITDLFFPAAFQESRVRVEYLTVPYGIISEQGKIIGEPDEQGSLVEITATLSCQEETMLYTTGVKVFPVPLSPEQDMQNQIRAALENADARQAESAYLDLPRQVDGKRITWRYPPAVDLRLVWVWCLLLPPVLWLGRDAAVHRRARQRNLQLAMDYPEILWRMTMLLGAGLSVRSCFIRIVSGYQSHRAKSGKRYVYEEMAYTLREMDSGVGEAASYESFGRRCALPGYIKFGSLLATHVRKGSADLRQMLEQEAQTAMQERQNMAMKEGERAATRMLFPMILMLGVVIAILLIPAFMSMH